MLNIIEYTPATPSVTPLPPAFALIGERDVRKRLANIGRATLYRWLENDPSFPKRHRLGGRRVAWRTDEIDKWIVDRKDAN